MDLGERIQQLRKDNNLSQEQLAERLQISRQSVSKWEAGQSTPELDKIIQLSEIFDITTDYLLKGKTAENHNTVDKDKKVQYPSGYSTVIPILASGINIIGLITMITLWNTRFRDYAIGTGLVIQILGCVIFEMAACLQRRTGDNRYITAHLKYYALNVWFLLFIPVSYMMTHIFSMKIFFMPYKLYIVPYIMVCTFTTCLLGVILYIVRRKSRG